MWCLATLQESRSCLPSMGVHASVRSGWGHHGSSLYKRRLSSSSSCRCAVRAKWPVSRSPFSEPGRAGVLNAALAVADAHDAELVLANDPDGDRLAVAIKVGVEWHQLTGDELGLLLCDHQLATTSGNNRLTASSFVSSRQSKPCVTSVELNTSAP